MKLLLSILFTFSFLSASSYETALAEAKAKKKNLMVMITTDNCGWCKKMKRDVLVLEDIKQELSKNHIFVELNKRRDSYPEKLYPRFVPTFYTISATDEKIINERFGYQNKSAFLSYINDN
jgi:thiol-disulfide isomerase/thioredoxin